MDDMRRFDVIVLGAGSGLTAAYHANKDGKSVAVVEADPTAVGDTCVNRGCIPTKRIIQSADVLKTIREAHRFGIGVDPACVKADFKSIMDSMRRHRVSDAKKTKSWVDGTFTPIYAKARFVDEKVIETDDGTRLTGEKIFITTGSRPSVPPISGLAETAHWTSDTILEIDARPERLIILGAGPVGCEFGHFFAELGTRVTVIGRSGCLKREDDDLRECFTRVFEKKVDLVLGVEASETRDVNGRREIVVTREGGKTEAYSGDGLLIATGRRPNTETLDLDKTGVGTTGGGWIAVDGRLQTSHPDIYAYGDVIGRGMFKHTSRYEGRTAYKNSQGAGIEVNYDANPRAVFSDPQIGSVGLTERDCGERGIRYRAVKHEYSGIAKGGILGSPPGLAKLIVEDDTDKILGFHMAGPNAADLIHEVVVAMNAGDGTSDLIRRSIHIHPTMPELVRKVFDTAASNDER